MSLATADIAGEEPASRAASDVDETITRFEKPGFRTDIQGLRALAVALVVVYHAGFGFEGGFVGVDAFFVLSGFVITRRLRWEVATTGTVDIKEFLRRRVVRILPAASLLIAVTFIANAFLAPMSGRVEASRTGIAATLVNANNYLAWGGSHTAGYFDATTELNPFLHMWSLSVEEQFYLVFPLVVLGAAYVAQRRGRSADSTLISTFSVLLGISFLASLWIIGSNQAAAFYLAPFRAWEFLVGAAIVWVEHRRWSRSQGAMLGGLGMLLLIGCSLIFREGEGFPGLYALVPVIGTALLIIGGSGETNSLTKLLSQWWMEFVGRVSYAWYLWHWPLIVFAKATFPGSTTAVVLGVVVSFGLAVASTLWFEEPVRSKPRTGMQSARVAMTCVAVSVCAFVVADLATSETEASESGENFALAFRASGPEEAVCWRVVDGAPECVHAVDNPIGDALLLGDSTALSLFPGMIEASELVDRDLTMTYLHACATNRVNIRLGEAEHVACPLFWDGVLDELDDSAPDVAVVAIAIDRYISADTNELQTADGTWVSSPKDRAALIGPAIIETVREVSSKVDNVIFVGITPKFDQWQPDHCSFARWTIDPTGCGTDRTWDEIASDRRLALEIQDEIIALPNVEFVSLDRTLCDELGCSTNRGDEWVFQDYGHISTDQSESLGPILAAAIENVTDR